MNLSVVNVKYPGAFIKHPFEHLLNILYVPVAYNNSAWYQKKCPTKVPIDIIARTFGVNHATVKMDWSNWSISTPNYTVFHYIIETLSLLDLETQFPVNLDNIRIINEGLLDYRNRLGNNNHAWTVEESESFGVSLLKSSITKLTYFKATFKSADNWYREMSKLNLQRRVV